jgi:hypothetical protein
MKRPKKSILAAILMVFTMAVQAQVPGENYMETPTPGMPYLNVRQDTVEKEKFYMWFSDTLPGQLQARVYVQLQDASTRQVLGGGSMTVSPAPGAVYPFYIDPEAWHHGHSLRLRVLCRGYLGVMLKDITGNE